METDKAAIGRMTMRSKERVVLIHYYRHALVAATLRYSDEAEDPGLFPGVQSLPHPSEKEIHLAREIADRLTRPLDLTGYRDSLQAENRGHGPGRA